MVADCFVIYNIDFVVMWQVEFRPGQKNGMWLEIEPFEMRSCKGRGTQMFNIFYLYLYYYPYVFTYRLYLEIK